MKEKRTRNSRESSHCAQNQHHISIVTVEIRADLFRIVSENKKGGG